MIESEVATQQITEWIKENLTPKISKSLGKRSDKVRCDVSFPENSFFVSCVCFLDLTFESDDKNGSNAIENKVKLVIKRPPLDKKLAELMKMSVHFNNEILFYKKIGKGNPRFPRCVFTAEDTPENTVVVTENMSPFGYAVCEQAYDIPLEYVYAGIEEIARFHAMGYVMKEQQPEEFKNAVNHIQEARFMAGDFLNNYIDLIASRPISWLRKHNYDPKFCDTMERFFDNAFQKIVLPAISPVEPLANICHGDFTRNNIFFRRVDGKLEGMLIDFALITYSSPGIDLSTFLFLNASTPDRIRYIDDIFKLYHDTLIGCMRKAGITDLEKYSYDKMYAEYKRVAAFGYVIASFFLPITRDPSSIDFETARNDYKASAANTRKMGGEAMDEVFAKMVLELRDTGCLDHVC